MVVLQHYHTRKKGREGERVGERGIETFTLLADAVTCQRERESESESEREIGAETDRC
jgi:hypothetical protein